MTALFGQEGAAGGLRAGLLLLVALGVAGSALALAYERHWHSAWQLAPWITLGVITVAAVALAVRPAATTIWLARAVAVLAIVSAALGVWQHIDANYNVADHAHHDHGAAATPTSDDHHNATETPSDDHHHDDAETSDDHHHDDADASDDDHHAATATPTPASAESGPSLADAMSGAAGHAPVPAALAIMPVGLALGLATIGLRGRRRAPPD